MGEAGRAQEAIEEIEALPAGEVDDRELTIAWLLAQDGRVEQAIARLRPLPGKQAATDLAELLIRQTRFAEAVAVIPDVAAQREERRFWTGRAEQKEMAPSDGGDGWGDPWTAANAVHLEWRPRRSAPTCELRRAVRPTPTASAPTAQLVVQGALAVR
jgi:hypothetical protein